MVALDGFPTLEIRTECHGCSRTLFLAGELDLSAVPLVELHAFPAPTDAEGAGQDLVIDLEGITFCDSSGAAALIRVLERTKRAKGRLTLTGIPRQIRRRLGQMGVIDLFHTAEPDDAEGRPPRAPARSVSHW
ncbi:STAS domain-containing protein [Spongiactinospora sp. TRM90649]|uniref:STAS domain-containing protein n=1 Tax=Spongiactinospora sp. TRM90649 TaxID=3031114 RepID=UPI0023F7536D|nr:STAS domain-containing protein [Spongiactinospora sp. TRM90649]MDF5757693.1 STAS domain-containing protein [Spongiactinospora sp. TRM90649]